jgi:FkbM family methyltransferase
MANETSYRQLIGDLPFTPEGLRVELNTQQLDELIDTYLCLRSVQDNIILYLKVNWDEQVISVSKRIDMEWHPKIRVEAPLNKDGTQIVLSFKPSSINIMIKGTPSVEWPLDLPFNKITSLDVSGAWTTSLESSSDIKLPNEIRKELPRSKNLLNKHEDDLIFDIGMNNRDDNVPPIMRTPRVSETLGIFKACFNRPIKAVLDVGAQVKTQFLIDAFPNALHYLFEPVEIYHSSLASNYRAAGVNHELIAYAVSDQPGLMYQHLLSSDKSGSVTHSQLLTAREPEKFGSKLLDIIETPVISLDQWATKATLSSPYVLKIDVDGIEELIIEGGKKVIAQSALVIVESPLSKISSRIDLVESLGMQLFDITGNGYYFGQLSQVDLIFISSQVVERNIEFRPWEKHKKIVIWEHWQQY